MNVEIAASRMSAIRQATEAAWIGLILAVLFGLLPLARWISPNTTTSALLLREAVWWILAAALMAWLRFGERLPVASLGIRRPTWKTIALGLLAAVASTAVIGVYFGVIVPRFHLDIQTAVATQNLILKTPYWFRVILVLRAAIVEEFLFRAYLIEKVRQITGRASLAVVCSVAAFTLAHLSGWGAAHLIPVGCVGIILALLYVWRRDLGSNWVAHFIMDALGFLTR